MDEALTYELALRWAILSLLDVKSPPYIVEVDSTVGDAAVTVLDSRKDPRDPSPGAFVANALLSRELLGAADIIVAARAAVEQMRPDIDAYLKAKGERDRDDAAVDALKPRRRGGRSRRHRRRPDHWSSVRAPRGKPLGVPRGAERAAHAPPLPGRGSGRRRISVPWLSRSDPRILYECCGD